MTKPTGWTADQMIRFGSYIISPSLSDESYQTRLELFREHEKIRGIEAPEPVCNHIWWSFGDSDLLTCRLCGKTILEE